MSDVLPKIYDDGCLDMFPVSPKEHCENIGLAWSSAVILYRDGLISFDPESMEALSESQRAELTFVGALTTANYPRHMLEFLLSDLTPPYSYSHAAIYYDWHFKGWKPILDDEDVAWQWLEKLHEEEDLQTLEAVESRVAEYVGLLRVEEKE